MKTLFFDCGMGAAGDMLTAALLELMPDREAAVAELNALGIPGIVYEAETAEKCGIQGTHMSVKINGEEEAPGEGEHEHHHHHDGEEGHEHHHHHDYEAEEHSHHHDELHEHTHTLADGTVITHTHEHEHTHEHTHDHEHSHDHEHGHSHHHAGMHDIEEIVAKLPVSEKVRADVMAVYGLIGEAESHAHGVPVTEIHFHEVGTMDAVADVTAVCYLMEKLAPEQVLASPVHVGAGTVRCAHGVLPVPAPATAYILRGVPIYGGRIESELCTPTGAALLKHFVSSFGDMPVMKISAVGYGCGKKDFFRANVVRAMLGETADAPENTVCELNFNVDDMTAEEIGFASERFFEAGAMDVFTIPIGMKKSRPGTLVSIICRPEDRDEIVKQVFLHTSTIGMREKICERYVLNREIDTVETGFGPVRVKRSSGYGVTREKYEYDDLARIAKETGLSLKDIKNKL